MICAVGRGIWMLCGVIHDRTSLGFRHLLLRCLFLLLVANGAGQEPVAGSPLRNDGYN